eukprot:725379-Karenia_brevis.AAC.1
MLEWALADLKSKLLEAPPRVVGPRSAVPPIIVFTDGACEDRTSIGGVLVLPSGRLEAFGAVVSQDLVEAWKSRASQEQVIGQAEIFPVLVARLTWAHDLEGQRAIFFIDNEAARLGLVKSYSPILASLKIIAE